MVVYNSQVFPKISPYTRNTQVVNKGCIYYYNKKHSDVDHDWFAFYADEKGEMSRYDAEVGQVIEGLDSFVNIGELESSIYDCGFSLKIGDVNEHQYFDNRKSSYTNAQNYIDWTSMY